MGEMTLLERVREWVGGIGWRVFLWGSKRTEEEYWEIIRESFDTKFRASQELTALEAELGAEAGEQADGQR